MPEPQTYSIYNLDISSSIPLPELWPSERAVDALNISHEEQIPNLSEVYSEGWLFDDFMYVQRGAEGVQLHIQEICHIWFKSPYAIVINPDPGVHLEDIKVYLLGSGLALHLMTQGQFCLHASTVANGTHCISFMGHSGAGKSTTAAWFLEQGHQLLADDVSLVSFLDTNQANVWPAHPGLKLWPDALTQLGRDPALLPVVFQNDTKRRLNAQPQFSTQGPVPLKAIFLLDPTEASEELNISRVQGRACFELIAEHIYRVEAVTWLGQTANHFLFCTRLAQLVPVFRIQRPRGSFELDALYAQVNKILAQL